MTPADPGPQELVVLLGGRVAGVLRRGNGPAAIFTYDDEWQGDKDAYPLSLSLPLARRVHDGPEVSYYLRGLLPDNESRLNAIAHYYGVAPDDAFALLACIGEDCPGAVQFARPDRVDALAGDGPSTIQWLADHDVAELLRKLTIENVDSSTVLETGQFSLPGALAKVALVWNARTERWGRPIGRTPTTHILKPPLAGIPFHSENEHLCLELARHLGCPASASFVLRIEDQVALAVQRYDRAVRHGHLVRLHQEDLSQALGVNPRLKYAAEGAPGMTEIVALLRDHTTPPLESVYQFVRAVALNWVIAGTDAHARNYSVLIQPGSTVVLAPVYDLASALLFNIRRPVTALRLAMAVGGHTMIGDITRRTWVTAAQAMHLTSERVIEELQHLIVAIPNAAETVAAAAAQTGIDTAFCSKFAARISARARVCARDLESI